MEKTIKATLVPINLRLNVDEEFTDIVRKKLQGKKIGTDMEAIITISEHKILFKIKSCEPTPSVVCLATELTILKINTREDMKLSETDINVFMTDEAVKGILARMIYEEYITELNGIKIWREFKQYQKEALEET